jgi:hypothetical protein
MRPQNVDRANLTAISNIGERLVPLVLSTRRESYRAPAGFGNEYDSAAKILRRAEYFSPHRGSRLD